jgi:hypothetical protein
MKHFQFSLGALVMALGLLVGTGCFQKDPCKNVDCNNGNCVDGTCECDPGYSGSDCSTLDPCYNVACDNGDCVNGNCICDAGYEGDDCADGFNAKFVGTYFLNETCNTSGPASYSVIGGARSTSVYEATLTGLWEAPSGSVIAVIGSNGTSFSIARQSIDSNIELEGSGTASVDGNTLNITYTIYINGSMVETCVATLTK